MIRSKRVFIATAIVAAVGGCAQILGLEDPRDPPSGDAGAGAGDGAGGGDGGAIDPGDGGTSPDGSTSGDSSDPDVYEPPQCSATGIRCGGPLGNTPVECEAGSAKLDVAPGPCPSICLVGLCVDPGSCVDDAGAPALRSCGPAHDQSCCAATAIPAGSFSRSYDGVTAGATDPSYRASVSMFVLDRFEVTVGRFRKFVAVYDSPSAQPPAKPAAGAGKNPHDLSDPGWDPTWPLPADAAALVTMVKKPAGTWTDTVGANESKPITSLDWYTAFAFCIWDSGRLPTEAEWNYAAAGGGDTSGQRVYPWSNPPGSTAIASTMANYGSSEANDVGSRSPKGDGRWGQSDLAGNASEWVLDRFVSPYPSKTCTNCGSSAVDAGPRVIRGGYFIDDRDAVTASKRSSLLPDSSEYFAGVRCARTFR